MSEIKDNIPTGPVDEQLLPKLQPKLQCDRPIEAPDFVYVKGISEFLRIFALMNIFFIVTSKDQKYFSVYFSSFIFDCLTHLSCYWMSIDLENLVKLDEKWKSKQNHKINNGYGFNSHGSALMCVFMTTGSVLMMISLWTFINSLISSVFPAIVTILALIMIVGGNFVIKNVLTDR